MLALIVTLFVLPISKSWAQAPMPVVQNTTAAQQQANKKPAIRLSYPGGQDEDDLKVQSQLFVPTATLDRRTLNAKVVKNAKNNSGDEDDGESPDE